MIGSFLRVPLRSKRDEAGLFIVLFAVVAAVLALLVAIVVGIGYLSTSRARLQNSTNLASLAAVEEFFRESDDGSVLITDRANNAMLRAQAVLASNHLLSADSQATGGDLGLPPAVGANSTAAGGTVRFGTWFAELPTGGSDPCAGDYPCFQEALPPPMWTPPYPVVNAIRLETKTQGGILAPMGAILGSSTLQSFLTASSTAFLVPRCTAFLVDASLSTTEDSHPTKPTSFRVSSPPSNGDPTLCAELNGRGLYFPPSYYLCPRNLSLFAYNDWLSFNRDPMVLDVIELRESIGNPCRSSTSWIYTNAIRPPPHEGHLWCNMQWENFGPLTPPLPSPLPAPYQRQTIFPDGSSGDRARCFEPEGTPYGRMYIDKCIDPEPLTSFMLGFNAGVRMLESQRTAADRVKMNIFRAVADINPYPPSGFAADPSVMVQLTNVKNRGIIANGSYNPGVNDPSYLQPVVHPNFVDMGWYPIMKRGTSAANTLEEGTNIVAALRAAIADLSNPAFCPSGAQKSIIIATDGSATCAPGLNPLCSATSYPYFQESERQLLSGSTSVLADLRRARIALTAMISGASVQPHFIDREQSGEFLDYREAVAVGFRGLTDQGGGNFAGDPAADPLLLVDSRAECPGVCPGATQAERDAYAFANQDAAAGVYFRRPIGVMAHLAIETGGIFCPLLPVGNASDYEDDPDNPGGPKRLKPSLRTANGLRTVASHFLSPGETAAECVQQTLSGNPFGLVAE